MQHTFQAKPTAAQIDSGYFILPRKLHIEWKYQMPWEDFTVSAFGKDYKGLRLDQNYRVRVRLKEFIEPGDLLNVTVVLTPEKRLLVERA